MPRPGRGEGNIREAPDSSAPAGAELNIAILPTGCASLHPWLHSCTPSGLIQGSCAIRLSHHSASTAWNGFEVFFRSSQRGELAGRKPSKQNPLSRSNLPLQLPTYLRIGIMNSSMMVRAKNRQISQIIWASTFAHRLDVMHLDVFVAVNFCQLKLATWDHAFGTKCFLGFACPASISIECFDDHFFANRVRK